MCTCSVQCRSVHSVPVELMPLVYKIIHGVQYITIINNTIHIDYDNTYNSSSIVPIITSTCNYMYTIITMETVCMSNITKTEGWVWS